jgi:predicted membrane metal-binding protein
VVGDIDSLTRAWVMALLILGARTLVRPPKPIDALGTALLLMLLWRPCSILSVGLQLSFAATLALLLCVQRLPNVLLRPPASSRPRLVRVGLRAGQGAVVAFVVSAAVELFIAPLQLEHFGQLSLVGPLATVVFLLPVTILQGLALVASLDVPVIGAPLIGTLAWTSNATLDAILVAGNHAPSSVQMPAPDWLTYYGAIALLCWRWRQTASWAIAALALALSFMLG